MAERDFWLDVALSLLDENAESQIDQAFESFDGNFSLPTGSRCPNQIRQRRNGVFAQQPILKIMPKRNLVL